MNFNPTYKIKILKIIDILKETTDEDNPLTADEICRILNTYGIKAERKSIYRDISMLCDYGMDINKTTQPKRGFYLASRDFEIPEVKLLIDAVLAATFITNKKTDELVNKLLKLVSSHQSNKLLGKNDKKSVKSENEEIYYSIYSINNAIYNQEKIKFLYENINKCEEKVISPIRIFWENDQYYLEGFESSEGNNTSLYHINKIKKAHLK